MTMPQDSTFNDTKVAQSANELLSIQDYRKFLYCAYLTLLKREPDQSGLNYYLDRLNRGVSKINVLVAISLSDEAINQDVQLDGMKAIILKAKLLNLFGYGKAKEPSSDNSKNNILENKVKTVEQPIASPVNVIKIDNQVYLKSLENKSLANPNRTIWIDLTTCMEWTGGVVGIVRAELEIACGMHKISDNVRFSMQIENGFVEIEKSELEWLTNAENVADAYMNFFGRYKLNQSSHVATANLVNLKVPDKSELYYPFKENDVVIAVGWMDSKKEVYFTKVKEDNSKIFLGYLVYDIILVLEQTRHFYHELGQQKFQNYVKWISHNCDFILYGGETAKKDTEQLQKEMCWPSPPGTAVQFGTDIVKIVNSLNEQEVIANIGITGPYVMTVGSIEPRKNHETIYKAYLLAVQSNQSLPQLIICGRPAWRTEELVSAIDRDPRVKGHIIRISPTDTELAILYKHCLFTLLPSLYEGWSLTLPESLGQGKFCLCSDTPPLREIGKDLVDYVEPWDTRTWANKIAYYSQHTNELKLLEQRIIENWPTTRWLDTAEMVLENISKLTTKVGQAQSPYEILLNSSQKIKPTIWMDITLSFLDWQGNVNGIVRTELNYARYLKKIAPDTRFFAYSNDCFFEVEESYLLWLFNDSDLSSSYAMFQEYWKAHEENGTGYKNPLRVMSDPKQHVAYIEQFPVASIVLFVGIDFIYGREKSRILDVVSPQNKKRGVLTSQLIYDFTPILFPQVHVEGTCIGYTPFIKHVSENFGHLLYGGRTAQRDGIKIQQDNGWRVPPSDYIEFGSDFEKSNILDEQTQQVRDQELLSKMGVSHKFIMTVGTIEPRKNHEMLYKAYVTLLSRAECADLPQMLFIGKKGWKTDDFLATFEADTRIKGKILMLSPTDEELDVLYRYCMFTLLPSFYEGWSLTLPESLSYGKLCLTSDVDPLRETGRDLVEYINPLDTYAWADRIHFYATHPDELIKKESYIKDNWKARTWVESTQMLLDALYKAHQNLYNRLNKD